MTGNRTTFAKLAVSAAAVSLLLSGCGMGGNQSVASASAKPAAAVGGKAVAKAEAAVLKSPRDAATRVALGNAYLGAGRFASAAEAFNDALNLGDEGAGTALGLALAETALGNTQSALELLRDYRDVIPAGDLGLAYALAGDTARGVSILSDAMRNGDDTAKVRQNLAYALALDGQWAQAKVMAAQDIPADQVNARIIEWVRTARPEAVQLRVANLIGTTPVADSGQPEQLALANFPSTEQLAMEAQAQAPAPVEVLAAPVELAVAEPAPVEPTALQAPVAAAPAAELPAMAAAPVAQPITLAALDKPTAGVATDTPAFASLAVPGARRASPVPAVKPRTVGKFAPQVKDAVQPGKGKGIAALASAIKAVTGGSHWVQLGSYTNPAIAKDGWGKFTRRTPALKGYKTVTTTAVVDGTPVWRVAASGFASYGQAKAMCDMVKSRGGACLVKRAEVNPGAISALRK